MYSSTSYQAPTSFNVCALDDENDTFNDNGNKTSLDPDASDFTQEIYLCMVWHGGFLGLAFYELGSLQIHFMLDVQENDDFSLVRQVVHQIHPSVIALNTIQDSRLISFLRAVVSEICVAHSGSSNNVCRIEFLPNVDFNYQVSKRRILALNLPSVPKHLSGDKRHLHFATLFPFGNSNMISSIGGLLKYLEKTRVGIELEADIDHVPILGFKAFIPEHQIQMDGSTYNALKIFETEAHPSTYKAAYKSEKEGLSLYGILNRCKSRIGSRMLREWFLRPLKSASPVRQRHEAVAFFMSSHNMEVVQCLTGCLKHIKYIPKVLHRMSKAQATIGDWIALYKTLYHAVYIGDIANAQPGNIEIFRKIKSTFTEDLHKCVNLISKTIDFEESKIKKKFVVLPHIDKNLDEKKRMFNGLPDLMSEVARQEIEGLRSDIKECVISYLPQIGYLLVIELPEGKSRDDNHTIEGLQFRFATDNQLFYKSAKTLELDDILGDIQLEIIDIELKTMHRLQTTILESTSVMLSIMDLAAELDCLMALATCAKEFGYIQPQLVQETTINIKAGRHPLQELCCNVFVPNDIKMGGNSTKMKLITGPNACGKSVYLKQVALIVFMAHIGSFVPAEEASIGPIDGIFTRLKSTESVTLSMSTFMQDLSQVSLALKTASGNSLVILDEFGKGTESTDGLSLLTAIIKHWMAKESDCPFTLVSTHFHSIIQQRLLPRTSRVEYLTFDTLANEEELIYLYQLIPGHTSSSYACKCAVQVGISYLITQRGQQVSDLLCQHKTVPLEDSVSSLKRRQMREKIVDSFLDLNLRVDDVNSFLKNFVLKTCSDKYRQDPNTASKDSFKQTVDKEISSHIKSKDKTAETESNEKIGQKMKESNHNVKKTEGSHFLSTKTIPATTTSVSNSEKENDITKTGGLFRVDLASSNTSKDDSVDEAWPETAVLHCDNEGEKIQVEQYQTRNHTTESSFTIPKNSEILVGNTGKNHQQQTSQHMENRNKSIFPISCTHPLYAIPSSPMLKNEIFQKSKNFDSLSAIGRKRRGENVKFNDTDTQIKHEKLFNPPASCFQFPVGTSSMSAPSTKFTSDISSRQQSTTTTDSDNNDLRQRQIKLFPVRCNPSSQTSAIDFIEKTSDLFTTSAKLTSDVSLREESTTADSDDTNIRQRQAAKLFPVLASSEPQMSDVMGKAKNPSDSQAKRSPSLSDFKEDPKKTSNEILGNPNFKSISEEENSNHSSAVVVTPNLGNDRRRLKPVYSSTEYPSTSC